MSPAAPTASPLSRARKATALSLLLLVGACSNRESKKEAAPQESAAVRRIRQVYARVPETLAKNYKEFDASTGRVSGFGAGDAYPQIWLRDSAWIINAAAAYYPETTLTSWLDLHLANAEKGGRLRDWVAKGSPDAFREWAPRVQSRADMAFDTNSNESDQEPSAALAFCRASQHAKDISQGGKEVIDARRTRVNAAMSALLRDRTDPRTGLIWSGLTADWGDVSPLYPDQQAIYLDAKTPRTLSLYSNVMVYGALACLSDASESPEQRDVLATTAARLRERIRATFWMKDRGYFRIRAPFDPLPAGFSDDDDRFALGGNALAALFRVADDEQAASIFKTAERLRVASEASTISPTLIPPYASGVFQHPAMREPFQYQNGGQWDWFGAALVQAEFERGAASMGRNHFNQIVSRILRAGPGIHEWYGADGSPQGSAAYAAAAASLHNAIVNGWLGIERSREGLRVTLRTGETLLPFEIPDRASNDRLIVSQTIRESSIDVEARSSTRLIELCAVVPEGRKALEVSDDSLSKHRSKIIGNDTLVCADVAQAAMPVQVRFSLMKR